MSSTGFMIVFAVAMVCFGFTASLLLSRGQEEWATVQASFAFVAATFFYLACCRYARR